MRAAKGIGFRADSELRYGRGRTRQFSVCRERVAEVRRWLNNYRELENTIEAICNSIMICSPTADRPKWQGSGVIEMKRRQLSFGDGLIEDEVQRSPAKVG
jgi:hypothetical protein